MSAEVDYRRFERLSFDEFRRLAADESLSPVEKVGFPQSYRAGKEGAIFRDIVAKLAPLGEQSRVVLDIGPGCSDVAWRLIEHCETHGHELILVDSAEMLALLPDVAFARKYAARFPDCEALFAQYDGRINAIICYSVLHYVFEEGNVFDFLDRSLQLLAPGGAMLLGDIPNASKRKRFFASARGAEFHKAFTGRDEEPVVAFNQAEPGKIDDAVVLALVQRCRAAGCDAYVLPQPPDLPLANRREDILICKP